MRNSLETKLGIFVFLAVVAAWIIVETLGSTDWFHHGYHVSAQFDTVQDLKPGDRVKMAGVEIGRVEDIQLGQNKVKVILRLRDNSQVKTDSKASVKYTGLMGQNFVNIDFGSPGSIPAQEGTELSTYEQPDLSALMAKLDGAVGGIQNLTKSFSGDDIHNLFGPLGDFFKSHRDELAATIANITNISGQIASGQGTVGRLIYEDTLYSSAMTTVTNLQTASASANDMIAAIKLVVTNASSGKGTLGKLLTDDSLYNATDSSMTNLNQILQKINQGNGTIGKLVNDQEFYKNAKVSLQKLDKAADGLEDQGPLSVIGILAGPLGL
ncbi:MAG: MlaD family protein [Verrucomicrobiota bacterium]|jgi:phospholipid/cholesterol/gamma-HCH transport system substrate-binding protein